MIEKLTNEDKIEVIKLYFLPMIEKSLIKANLQLEQAKNDYINLNSMDGNRQEVKKAPILSVVDGQVQLESVLDMLPDLKKMLEE